MSTSSTTQGASQRQSWTEAERQTVREYAAGHPGSNWRQIKSWFDSTYAPKQITQTQISKFINAKQYCSNSAAIDSIQLSKLQPTTKRIKTGRHPELNAALFEWQQIMQKRKIAITGLRLQEKASQFWNQMPIYAEIEPPKFSEGWLTRWKARYNVKKHSLHGEAGSVELGQEDEEMIQQIQTILATYNRCDIYNMDKTRLYWRKAPNITLATEVEPGIKQDKSRLTACICSNADGSDKLDIWFIGYYKNPRAFKNINQEALGGKWRFNKTAWNNTTIMKEWLLWFQDIIARAERRVALVLDNFSAHECAVNELEADNLLPNVHILWLPPHTTSLFQPMDQGIIRAWKAHYRRAMMKYIVHQADINQEENPYQGINILYAIQWGVQSWRTITSTTIEHCFSKSQIKLHGPYQLELSPHGMDPSINIEDIEDEILDCIRVAHPGLSMN